MKKIIAMLLAVAMVAALGVSAFADVKRADAKTTILSIDDWKTILVAEADDVTSVKAYANALAAAKLAYNAEKKVLAEMVNNTAKAYQTAQYWIAAEILNYQAEQYELAVGNAINEAIAQAEIDIAKDYIAQYVE